MFLPHDHPDRSAYTWMVKNAVVPRPIAWIGTQDAEGTGNLAPFSYFTLLTMEPPTLMFSVIGNKDTHRNILATGEFVVNLPSEGDAEAVAASAAVLSPEIDEAAANGLLTAPGISVSAPRLLDAAVALECRFVQQIEFNAAQLVFGQITGVHVRDDVLDSRGRIDVGAYRPLGRLGGSLYTDVREAYRVPIPGAHEVPAAAGAPSAD